MQYQNKPFELVAKTKALFNRLFFLQTEIFGDLNAVVF